MNVLLDDALNAKLCDLGLTQPMEAEKAHISRKANGESGSPRYLAPEVYDHRARITEKVDVWALGCLLIEIFGGPLPYFDCQNIQQICAKMMQRVPPALPPNGSPVIN